MLIVKIKNDNENAPFSCLDETVLTKENLRDIMAYAEKTDNSPEKNELFIVDRDKHGKDIKEYKISFGNGTDSNKSVFEKLMKQEKKIPGELDEHEWIKEEDMKSDTFIQNYIDSFNDRMRDIPKSEDSE